MERDGLGTIKTGDILVCSSWSITSLITKASTWSEWTHAGIAVWLKTNTGNVLHCFECGTDNEYDALTDKDGEGCRLVNVEQISHRYSKIAYRPINIKRDATFFAKLRAFMETHKNRPFKANYIKLAVANLGIKTRDKPLLGRDDPVFCSELVSMYLHHLGLLDNGTIMQYPHDRCTPKTFTIDILPQHIFSGRLTILHDNKMDDAIRMCLFVIQLCSLFLYILLTVELETKCKRALSKKR